jgi:hypothetical protein
MATIHVLCRTQFNFLSDNGAVSWVQFYEIPSGKVNYGDVICIYCDTTKTPFMRGIVLGTYKSSSRHVANNPKNETRLGIIFQIDNPLDKNIMNSISWPNGCSCGKSIAIDK